MGVVYEAFDRQRGERVALKTLPNIESEALYRFKREFRTLADIAHPNLVNLYELFIDGERCYFTMEPIDGETFLAHVRPGAVHSERDTLGGAADRHHPSDTTDLDLQLVDAAPGAPPPPPDRDPDAAPLDLPRLRAALRQLVEGVAALHAAGKLHRDLKPSNVLVDRGGRVVILDFGLATDARGPAADDGLSGTAGYMAPEQVGGRSEPASDWYAVGVMLYEALAGHRPFVGPMMQILRDKRERDPPPLDQLAPDLPPELVALCARLLARAPADRPHAAQILAHLGVDPERAAALVSPVSQDIELVGRADHLAALREAQRRAREGDAVAVYIYGPSGAGKSALCRAFLAERRDEPAAIILRSRCYVHESVPYKALDGVIDSLSRALAELSPDQLRAVLPRDAWALARLFPVLNAVLEAHSDRRLSRAPMDRLDLRRRAFTALRGLLARLGDRRPVILHIDDLQWADADSALLLDQLLRPPDAPPLLLLATFRSEEIALQPFLRQLLASADGHTRRVLPVDPLSDDQIEALVRAQLADHPGASLYTATIVREAAGSPFLAEQLTSYVRSGAEIGATGVHLHELLEARIRGQPEGAATLLDTLAVAAHPLAPQLAAAAAALRGDERPLIKHLLAANLLRISGPDERIELYHDRIREALAAHLDPLDRKRLHRRIAVAMESRRLDDYEAIFGHYRGAGDRIKAALYADKAATKAIEALAFDQAAAFYRHAIELAPDLDEAQDLRGTAASRLKSTRLERGLAESLANAGRCQEAADAYLRAAMLVDATRALELRRAAAEQLLISGHIDQGRRVLGEVLAQVGWRLAPSPQRALISLFTHRLQLRLHGLNFRPRTERELNPEQLLLIDICWAVSTGLSMIDNIRAADFQARGTLLALESGEPARIARALSMEAVFHASDGGPSRAHAAKLIDLSHQLALASADPGLLAQATMIHGACAYLVGEWRLAAQRLSEAEVMLRERCTGQIWQKATTQRFGLGSLQYLGELRELLDRLPFALRDAEERGNIYAGTDLRARLNLYWLARDDPQGYRREIDDALRRWTNDGYHLQHFNALRSLVQADLYENDPATAVQRIDESWPALDAAMVLRIQVARVEAHQLRASAGLASLAADPAPSQRRALQFKKQIDRDIHAIERERMPWAAALAALLRAGLAALQPDPKDTPRALQAAITGLRAADMALHAAIAERYLGHLEGGEIGARRHHAADAWIRAQGVLRPDRLALALAPGLTVPAPSPLDALTELRDRTV
jgi:hypothetical protein